MSNTSWPAVLRSDELKATIKKAKVLCVGAGGIGCELLKTLVCTGFEDIAVIDLDTIETSNLNRQFLFRKHHVGQSKAKTGAEVVQGFKPAARITPHFGNIKETKYDIDYFKQFDIVLNGLDNLEARRHVNRLCMAADRPLIESGTAGYLGQVTVHMKGRTECFECQPKPVPKSYPICTLRNTPDKPIHCIVWAKDLLFNRLFGKPETVSDLDESAKVNAEGDATAAPLVTLEAATTAGDGQAQAEEEEQESISSFLRREGESSLQYACRIFERVYTTDINRLVKMEELWEKRKPPTPLELPQILPNTADLGRPSSSAATSASKALGLQATEKWDLQQNARIFITSICMFLDQRAEEVGQAVFDKDDDLAVDFVTAASNLRALCYDIPTQSLFDAKGMAGNIIHAIATTNAIVSGLIVIEALKVLSGCLDASRNVYLYEVPSSKRMLGASTTDPPVKGCMGCGKAQLHVRLNTSSMTLSTFVTQVLKKRLAINAPMVMCGNFLYEEGEGLDKDEEQQYQALLPRTLAGLPGGGVKHGAIVHIQDTSQALNLDLIVSHQESLDEEKEPDGFVLEGTAPVAEAETKPQPEAAAAATAKPRKAAPTEDDQGRIVLDSDDDEGKARVQSKKRGRQAVEGEDAGPASAKIARSAGDGNNANGNVTKHNIDADADDDNVLIID